ncbi:hypothetical protein DV701_04345 [Ornithinimicrobium avium]|uniref:Uncharacterized protein n=1 Tax=Ornithinimicrobium avium TaxID=2283195 RepID=A0A345NKA3_9MICO|nr:hypothetical protein DV701_04345 [Ornithinimicrobium avium]
MVLLHGIGARSSEPFLQDRVAAAAEVLHVTPRTIRRRLVQANTLVARALRDPSLTGTSAQPVRLLSHHVTTDLRRPVVRLVSAKTVLRRRGGEIELRERFGTPGNRGPEAPTLSVGGAELLDLEPISASVWEASLRLPEGVAGTTAAYALTVEEPGIAALSPFTVAVPMQLMNRCAVTVHFGDLHPVTHLREVRNALPVTLYEPPVLGPDAGPAPPTVTLTADRPQLGLAFGYAWVWAEAGAG